MLSVEGMSYKPEAQSAQLSTKSWPLTSDDAMCLDVLPVSPTRGSDRSTHGRYRAIVSVLPELNERAEVWHLVWDICIRSRGRWAKLVLGCSLQGLLHRSV